MNRTGYEIELVIVRAILGPLLVLTDPVI